MFGAQPWLIGQGRAGQIRPVEAPNLTGSKRILLRCPGVVERLTHMFHPDPAAVGILIYAVDAWRNDRATQIWEPRGLRGQHFPLPVEHVAQILVVFWFAEDLEHD